MSSLLTGLEETLAAVTVDQLPAILGELERLKTLADMRMITSRCNQEMAGTQQ